jgi:hypothetical protein
MKRRIQQRSQTGIIGGVLDAFLVVLLTVAIITILANTGKCIYAKLKLSEMNTTAVDYARDLSYRSVDFPTGADQILGALAHAYLAPIVLPGQNVITTINSNAKVGNLRALAVTSSTQVDLIGGWAPITVSDTEVCVYCKAAGHIGFQTTTGQAGDIPDHAHNPIIWVPTVEAPSTTAQAEGFPSVLWWMQPPLNNTLKGQARQTNGHIGTPQLFPCYYVPCPPKTPGPCVNCSYPDLIVPFCFAIDNKNSVTYGDSLPSQSQR